MNRMLKITLLILGGVLVVAMICGGSNKGEEKPVAKVNNHVITEREFRQECQDSAYFQNVVGLTLESKEDFLKKQIRKELLIQEAMKSGLDKDEAFRQAIEKSWEQTLISALLRKKAASIGKEILVTQEEIEKRYRDMARSDPRLPSLEKYAPKLAKEIGEEKKTRVLERWIDDLWQSASITIYKNNLKSLR